MLSLLQSDAVCQDPELTDTLKLGGTRPLQVANYLRERMGQVVTSGELLRNAWGWDLDDSALSNLWAAVSRARALYPGSIETIRGVGYRWIDPTDRTTPTLRNFIFRMATAGLAVLSATDHRDAPGQAAYRAHHTDRANMKKAELRAAIADVLAALEDDDRENGERNHAQPQ